MSLMFEGHPRQIDCAVPECATKHVNPAGICAAHARALGAVENCCATSCAGIISAGWVVCLIHSPTAVTE